jgi:hypothetical protein
MFIQLYYQPKQYYWIDSGLGSSEEDTMVECTVQR